MPPLLFAMKNVHLRTLSLLLLTFAANARAQNAPPAPSPSAASAAAEIVPMEAFTVTGAAARGFLGSSCASWTWPRRVAR